MKLKNDTSLCSDGDIFPYIVVEQGLKWDLETADNCYRIYKATGNIEDKITWKKTTVKETRTSKEEKKREWQSYVNPLTINTNASLVLLKIKSIHGKPLSTVNMLKENDIVYTSIEKNTEKIAQSFQEITSNLSWHLQFLDSKEAAGQEQLNFESSNGECYNDLFFCNFLIAKSNQDE